MIETIDVRASYWPVREVRVPGDENRRSKRIDCHTRAASQRLLNKQLHSLWLRRVRAIRLGSVSEIDFEGLIMKNSISLTALAVKTQLAGLVLACIAIAGCSKAEKTMEATADVAEATTLQDLCKREDIVQSAQVVFRKSFAIWANNTYAGGSLDDWKQSAKEIDPQFIEVKSDGVIGQTSDNLMKGVACEAVVKVDLSDADTGSSVLEMRSFIYNIDFSQPTNNTGSKAFSITTKDGLNFARVFYNSRPLEKVFAEREAERDVNGEFWRRMREEGKNMDDVLNGSVDFEASKERIRQQQDGLVLKDGSILSGPQSGLVPTRSYGEEMSDDENDEPYNDVSKVDNQ